jgi:UDP-N-acetyl-D-glucosamine/UDP-N-acetyl-D-galactosamine dehydrogenase
MNIDILSEYPAGNGYGAIILAVAHKEFEAIDMAAHKANGTIIYDVKGILPRGMTDARL